MWTAVEAPAAGGAAPCARAKHSATLVGGHVYVLGGRGAGGAVPLKDLWRYSLASGQWERVSAGGAAPPALQEHSAVARGRLLYVFGGEAGAHPTETPLWLLDTEALHWRKVAATIAGPRAQALTQPARQQRSGTGWGPRGRRGHSAHALPDCMLVYGGYQDLRGSTNELWAFHYESESWQQVRVAAAAGPARHRHAAALHNGRLYVHGGMHDLRPCADLWVYDTRSRSWWQLRTPPKLSPSARSGHACVRAGAHLYVFGGESDGQPGDELWRFHFGSEMWERVAHHRRWPAPRVDACALLVSESAATARARSAPVSSEARAPSQQPTGLLREISKLSQFHIRRAARCSYTVLAAEQDSTESLLAAAAPVPLAAHVAKSRSAHALAERQPADGVEGPREGDEAGEAARACEPAVTRVEVAPRRWRELPKSASVRFCGTGSDDEWSASEYGPAEQGSRSSGFCNPHYVEGEAGRGRGRGGAAVTPDSGVAMAPGDIELRELAPAPPRPPCAALHVLLVGGKETPHAALLSRPLAMWTYRLL